MRWRERATGVTRHRARWLWWPLRIGGEWRWLERATWVEVWHGWWRQDRWVD